LWFAIGLNIKVLNRAIEMMNEEDDEFGDEGAVFFKSWIFLWVLKWHFLQFT